MQRADVMEKTLMLGKISGQEEKRTTEGEIVGWYHRVNEYEFQPTPGDSEGGGACCADSQMTQQLKNNNNREKYHYHPLPNLSH